MAICRDPQALDEAMNSDAVYSTASADAQKYLTLKFSRRPRGISVWAALSTLGRNGIAELVERHSAQARRIGEALTRADFEVLNRAVLNQVLFRCTTDTQTQAVLRAIQASGEIWFGGRVWQGQGRPALRSSVSSWRTRDQDVQTLVELLAGLYPAKQGI